MDIQKIIGVSSENQWKSLDEISNTFSLHQMSSTYGSWYHSDVIFSLLENITLSYNEHVTYMIQYKNASRPTEYPQNIFMFFYTYLN